jgi:DNA polymerase III epsilon subunit-like protein
MPKIVSVDLETTGLELDSHEVWEVGIVPLDSGREHMHFQFQPTDLSESSSQALQIGGFYERFDWIGDPRFARDMLVEGVITEEDEEENKFEKPSGHKAVTAAAEACWKIARELEGATPLGLNVGSFDAPFLAALLRKYGHSPTWAHRSLDLGSFAAGAWGAKQPLSGRAISDRLEKRGIENRAIHNAYADALWNVDAYNFIREGDNA